MTVPGNLSSPLLATAAADGAAAAGPIRSVRFNSADIAYLNKDFGSAGNRRTWTWSAWVKRTAYSATQCLFFGGATDSTLTRVIFGSDTLELQNFDSSTFNVRLETNHHFEDPAAWYHLIIAVDTNQATEADRVKMYINGVRETSFLAADYPEEGQQLHISNNVTHSIGVEDSSLTYYRFDGYMADVFFIDGQQLDETSFGAFDSNGVWQAAAYSGTFGTNGFHLFDFANESTVGHDSSGIGNDFTAHNITNETALSLPGVDFDGTNDHVQSADHADYSLGTNDFTIEAYIYPRAFSNFQALMMKYTGTRSTSSWWWTLNSSGHILFVLYCGSESSDEVSITTSGTGMTLNKWNHVACVRDGSTTRVYINGVQVGTASISTNSVNDSSTAVRIGEDSQGLYDFNGIMSNVRLVNGTCLYPNGTTFTVPTTPLTNVTNTKLLCCQSNSSAIAATVSPNTLSTSGDPYAIQRSDSNANQDVLFDVPTNGTQSDTEVNGNYCTLNPSAKTSGQDPTLTNGNLDFGAATNSNFTNSVGTIAVSSGKWYVEYTIGTNVGSSNGFGFINSESLDSAGGSYGIGQASDGWLRTTSVVYNNSSSAVSSLTSISSGDVVMLALDIDNGKAWWGLNGTFENSGDPGAGSNAMVTFTPGGKSFVVGISAYHSSVSASGVINFGARPFAYSAPSGFKALCTTNLPVSTLPDGSNHFDILTWDGDGTGSRSFTGLSFQPDLTWVKIRTQSYTHTLYDSVRGAGSGKELQSDSTNGEGQANTDQYGYLSSFNSDGFSSTAGSSDNDYFNKSGNSYVAWNWNAGANSNKTYSVKVVNDGGNNKYRFDDSSVSGYILELAEGSTYTFDCSDSSCDSHPFLIGSGSSVLSSGVVYTLDGVTKTFNQYTSGFAAATTRKLTLTIPASAPAYYYYCHVHSGMGATINTNATAGSSNLDGTEGAVVKANQAAGFSIITLNFGSVSGTISVGHGLNAAPHFWIMKDRDSADAWYVGHISIGAGYYLRFGRSASGTESLSDKIASTTLWDNTLPSNSLIYSNGTAMDGAGDYLMLAWAPVEGYSSFGSYVGNGLSDGPFVTTSFKVGFLMVKSHSASGAWRTYDSKRKTFNTINNSLHWDTNEDETVYSNDEIDFYSNGFKPKATGSFHNGTDVEYIYAAFAENPFQANGGLAR